MGAKFAVPSRFLLHCLLLDYAETLFMKYALVTYLKVARKALPAFQTGLSSRGSARDISQCLNPSTILMCSS